MLAELRKTTLNLCPSSYEAVEADWQTRGAAHGGLHSVGGRLAPCQPDVLFDRWTMWRTPFLSLPSLFTNYNSRSQFGLKYEARAPSTDRRLILHRIRGRVNLKAVGKKKLMGHFQEQRRVRFRLGFKKYIYKYIYFLHLLRPKIVHGLISIHNIHVRQWDVLVSNKRDTYVNNIWAK